MINSLRMVLRSIHQGGAHVRLQLVPATVQGKLAGPVAVADREDLFDAVLHSRVRLQFDHQSNAHDETRDVSLVREHVEIDIERAAGISGLDDVSVPMRRTGWPTS